MHSIPFLENIEWQGPDSCRARVLSKHSTWQNNAKDSVTYETQDYETHWGSWNLMTLRDTWESLLTL